MSPTARTLHIFVPGKILNAKNASGWIWQKRLRWARDWRERTAQAVWVAQKVRGAPVWPPSLPKRVLFLAQVGRLMDDDGLRVSISPLRDGLIDAHVIDDDGPTQGHTFDYEQVVKRYDRGVTITVELRPAPLAAAPSGREEA